MVDDANIKTTVSPFSIREGEIKTFDGKDGYVSINQIINKINLGHIAEVHFEVLNLINEFEFMTSRQIFQMLQYKGVDIKTQDKLNNKLEQLVKTKILTRYFFNSEEGKGIYRVYCMEKMGKYLLNSREIETRWQPTDNIKPVEMIKKRLAGNQIILAYLRKTKSFKDYVVKPKIMAKNEGKTIKANGEVSCLTKEGQKIAFVFECVRRELKWESNFLDRMKMYSDFYNNFVQFDSGYQYPPQLVFVCEDDKHTVETFKQIVKNKIELKNTKLYFTTDLRQNSDSLSNSLIEFKLDEETNKYKAKEVNLKMLV